MGDYEKAGMYYIASVKENNKPHEFVLPYYGLGQVQLKLGDLKSAMTNFEKALEVYPHNCETLKAVGHICIQLGQTEKAHNFIKKATKIDPRDPQAFLEMGELLLSSDSGAALDAFKTACNLLKKKNEEVPMELLNILGILHFERGELELAERAFKDALGEGIWLKFLCAKVQVGPVNESQSNENEEPRSPCREAQSDLFRTAQYPIGSSDSIRVYKDFKLFHQLEERGISVELAYDEVSTLFNLAILLEQLHDIETASISYRLISYKIADACKVDDNCQNALLMLGDLELKNDDWFKAKETYCKAKDMANGNDSYASLCLGNWSRHSL